jgi:hypothetical protein
MIALRPIDQLPEYRHLVVFGNGGEGFTAPILLRIKPDLIAADHGGCHVMHGADGPVLRCESTEGFQSIPAVALTAGLLCCVVTNEGPV